MQYTFVYKCVDILIGVVTHDGRFEQTYTTS